MTWLCFPVLALVSDKLLPHLAKWPRTAASLGPMLLVTSVERNYKSLEVKILWSDFSTVLVPQGRVETGKYTDCPGLGHRVLPLHQLLRPGDSDALIGQP